MTGPSAAGPATDRPDIPPSLAARPHDARRGLPIPPVNIHPDPTGGGSHVDFTTINTTTSTRTRFIPEHGFTVYLPAPFKTVRAYAYGLEGQLHPATDTR